MIRKDEKDAQIELRSLNVQKREHPTQSPGSSGYEIFHLSFNGFHSPQF